MAKINSPDIVMSIIDCAKFFEVEYYKEKYNF